MTETVQQPADMLARLGRKWGWVLAYGLITLAAGVAVLVWPGETLLVIAVLFGIQLSSSPRSPTGTCPSGAGPYSWVCSASSPASSWWPTRA